MVAKVVDYVVGVDTHRDEHTLALVEAATGTVIAQRAVAANGAAATHRRFDSLSSRLTPAASGRSRAPVITVLGLPVI
jgi:hypothetical protein